MLHYPHFAVPTVYLRNGYVILPTSDGDAYQFEAEDSLEDCIRKVLALRRGRLNGRELRFLRNGLGLTQAQLGSLIDRDEQTVARLEKDARLIPTMVDICVRAYFLAQRTPSTTVRQLVALVGDPEPSTERVILTWNGKTWTHEFESTSSQVFSTVISRHFRFAEQSLMALYGEFHASDPLAVQGTTTLVNQISDHLRAWKLSGNLFPDYPANGVLISFETNDAFDEAVSYEIDFDESDIASTSEPPRKAADHVTKH